jgi:hypothetical protein
MFNISFSISVFDVQYCTKLATIFTSNVAYILLYKIVLTLFVILYNNARYVDVILCHKIVLCCISY